MSIDITLRLTDRPGLYRLALFDNQRQQVVAISTDPPRRLEIGDLWIIASGDEPAMITVAPFSFDDTAPNRYAYCLVDADALEVSLPRPVVDLRTGLPAPGGLN